MINSEVAWASACQNWSYNRMKHMTEKGPLQSSRSLSSELTKLENKSNRQITRNEKTIKNKIRTCDCVNSHIMDLCLFKFLVK